MLFLRKVGLKSHFRHTLINKNKIKRSSLQILFLKTAYDFLQTVKAQQNNKEKQ